MTATNQTGTWHMLPVVPSDAVRFSGSDVTASFTSIYLVSPPSGNFSLIFSLNVINLDGTNYTIRGSLSFTVVPGPAFSLVVPNAYKAPIGSDAYVHLPEYIVCALDAGQSYADIRNSSFSQTCYSLMII
jgi:hypothetical protein